MYLRSQRLLVVLRKLWSKETHKGGPCEVEVAPAMLHLDDVLCTYNAPWTKTDVIKTWKG